MKQENGKTESASLLEARAEDLLRAADRGAPALSAFLSPAERGIVERFFAMRGEQARVRFWGGYSEAERVRLYLLPEYCLSIPEYLPPPDTDPALVLDDGSLTDAVVALRIQGSGFRELAHRDYLGSLLGLGLERDALGDIAVQDAHAAVVFCTGQVRRFLLEHLERIANDRVQCKPWAPGEPFTCGRKTVAVSDTVASARLDCAVAALAGLSREEARARITAGLVELDYTVVTRADLQLSPPHMLSVRGVGRFRLLCFDGETRKGRLRLRAEKFV